MNWRCWFGHDWKVLSYVNYLDISWSDEGCQSFKLRYICSNCRKVRIEYFYGGGYLTKELFEEMKKETNA